MRTGQLIREGMEESKAERARESEWAKQGWRPECWDTLTATGRRKWLVFRGVKATKTNIS